MLRHPLRLVHGKVRTRKRYRFRCARIEGSFPAAELLESLRWPLLECMQALPDEPVNLPEVGAEPGRSQYRLRPPADAIAPAPRPVDASPEPSPAATHSHRSRPRGRT